MNAKHKYSGFSQKRLRAAGCILDKSMLLSFYAAAN